MITALANHLWQSSLIAFGVGILSFVLRRNSAAVRYRLWLAASIKFLIPFSILTGIAGQFSPPAMQQIAPHVAAIAEFSHPFESHVSIASDQRALTASASPILLPSIAIAMWIGGMLAVVIKRWLQLRRVHHIVQQATKLADGREALILNKVLVSYGISSLNLISCRTEMEPGIFGIFRPLLLLPRDLAVRLNDSELESIFTHEVTHVMRHDNLTAFVHSVVEGVFWFHPMVWWIGGRLVHERERACDERTLQNGCSPRSYASGILKVCEFCIPSDQVLVSGITGAGLQKRIEEIMVYQIRPELSFAKKALLFGAFTIVVGGPIFFGLAGGSVQAQAPQIAAAVHVTAAPFSSVAELPQGQRGQTPRPNPEPAPVPAAVIPHVSDPANWMNTEVRMLATAEEITAFNSLRLDEERQTFIINFWTRRDPTPGTATNEFETEFYRRVGYANDHFTAAVPGSKSDRGKMYILNGPPDEVETHTIGGTFSTSSQGNNNFIAQTFPFELWRYHHIDGKGDNIMYEFVDQSGNGEYKLEYYPGAKDRR